MKQGLYSNIWAKRKRIKEGSGEKMRKPGTKGAPTAKAFKEAKGRAYFKAKEGANLKPPVSSKEAKKSPKAAARRKSFCARMGGMPGPMKDEKGRPTRKALALRKWDC
jgi:hypothetical protein